MKAIDVAAGLIFREGKLLIAQRLHDSHLGGLWEFPGGKRKPDETFPECLRRELKEELGVEVEVGDRVEVVLHEYPQKAVHLEFFLCTLRQGEPQPLGCAALRWVSRDDLSAFDFPAADAKLLGKLRQADDLWNG